jgi:hypothetical protein
MKTKSLVHKSALFGALVIAAVITQTANAAMLITISDVGANVVVAESGSINLGALVFDGPGTLSGTGLAPFDGNLVIGSGLVDSYTGIFTGPSSWGSGFYTPADSSTGSSSDFLVSIASLSVPQGYTSGTQFSGSDTFDNASIYILGLTPGSYVYTFGSGPNADSITIDVAAPEPATLTLFAVGISGLLLAARKGTKGRAQPRAFSNSMTRDPETAVRCPAADSKFRSARADRVNCDGALRIRSVQIAAMLALVSQFAIGQTGRGFIKIGDDRGELKYVRAARIPDLANPSERVLLVVFSQSPLSAKTQFDYGLLLIKSDRDSNQKNRL